MVHERDETPNKDDETTEKEEDTDGDLEEDAATIKKATPGQAKKAYSK